MRAPLTAVTFNGWVGQKPDAGRANLRDLADDTHRPHVIAGQEMHWLDDRIPPYVRHACDDSEEDGNNVLLIRKDVTIHRADFLRMEHARWVGPKHGRKHGPRVYPWADVSLPGERWRWVVIDVHRVTATHGKNDEQRRAEAEQFVQFVSDIHAAHPRRPIVALGDWNGNPLSIAARLGADVALKGIDGALLINAHCTGIRELGKKYGSDSHHPVALHVTAGAKK